MSTIEDILSSPEPGVGHLWVEMLSPESAIRARAAPASGPSAGITPVIRLEASSSEWWTLDYDARETSPHRGWTRLLWRGASTGEVGAMRGGDAR